MGRTNLIMIPYRVGQQRRAYRIFPQRGGGGGLAKNVNIFHLYPLGDVALVLAERERREEGLAWQRRALQAQKHFGDELEAQALQPGEDGVVELPALGRASRWALAHRRWRGGRRRAQAGLRGRLREAARTGLEATITPTPW